MALQRTDSSKLDTLINQTNGLEASLDQVEPKLDSIISNTDAIEGKLDTLAANTDTVEAKLQSLIDNTDTEEAKLQSIVTNTADLEATANIIEAELKKLTSTTPSAVVTISANIEQKTGAITIAAGVIALAIASTDGSNYSVNGKSISGDIIVDYPPLPPGYRYPAFTISGNVTIQESR